MLKFDECAWCPLSLMCVNNKDDGFSVCLKFNRKLFVFGESVYLMPDLCPMQEWVTRRMCSEISSRCAYCEVAKVVLREKLAAEKLAAEKLAAENEEKDTK